MTRFGVRPGLLILAAIGSFALPSCSGAPLSTASPAAPTPALAAPASDPSVAVSETIQTNGGYTTENGDAFDQAIIDIEKYKKVVLPDTAEIRRQGKDRVLQVFMRKHFGFHGHPGASMSIRSERPYMGCVTKNEGDALVLATFGEWDSHSGGTAQIAIVVVVPEDTEVEQRRGLVGDHSAGNGDSFERKNAELQEVKSKGRAGKPFQPEVWKEIRDVPDPQRRGAAAQFPPPTLSPKG